MAWILATSIQSRPPLFSLLITDITHVSNALLYADDLKTYRDINLNDPYRLFQDLDQRGTCNWLTLNTVKYAVVSLSWKQSTLYSSYSTNNNER